MIRHEDVRKVLRLTREVAEIPPGTGEREEHLLEGVDRAVGAPVAVVWRAEDFAPRRLPIRFVTTHDRGLDEGQQVLLGEYVAQEGANDPSHLPFARALERRLPGQVVTARREDVVPDRAWYAHPHVQDLRKAVGIDGFLVANYKRGHDGRVTILALQREWRERGFSPRERDLVDVFWSEAAALFSDDARPPREPDGDLHTVPVGPSSPRESLTRLTLRETQVAALAARGRANKQIALELGIARDTVKAYLSSAYRKTGADGRAALAHLVGRHDPRRETGPADGWTSSSPGPA